jgi:transcriptional regulator with XRE-family HTH domain
MTTVDTVGSLFREWRHRRQLSQLDLALRAGVSARHLSFVETGRTSPSRQMVLHLAQHLDVPLRERNRLLTAAGYAPVYEERALDGPDMTAASQAVDRVLRGHEPFPALAIDRRFNLVLTNSAVDVFLDGVDPELMRPPANMLRIGLHPRGLAPRVINLPEVRASLLARLARQAHLTGDAALHDLLGELRSYDPDHASGDAPPPGPHDIALLIRLRHGSDDLSFLNTITTFGTALDITLDEISIEAYFPADPRTAAILRAP